MKRLLPALVIGLSIAPIYSAHSQQRNFSPGEALQPSDSTEIPIDRDAISASLNQLQHFRFKVPLAVSNLDPSIRAVIVRCELYENSSVLPIATGSQVIAPQNGTVNGLIDVPVRQASALQTTYTSVVVPLVSGQRALKDINGQWACELRLSQNADGSRSTLPAKTNQALARANIVKVSGASWTSFREVTP